MGSSRRADGGGRWPTWLALPVLLGAGVAHAAVPSASSDASQVLGFEVAVANGLAFSSLWVESDRLGVVTHVDLADDGSVPEDLPWDGVYVGSQTGPYARYATVRVFGRDLDEQTTLLWEGIARTEDAWRPTLGFRVSRQGDHLRAERVAVALPTGPAAIVEGVPIIVAFGWGLFVLTYVGLLARRPAPEAPGARRDGAGG